MRQSTKHLFRLSLSAMLIAIGWLLPFLTGQMPTLGSSLLPMHLPVFIGGFLLGPYYGLLIGFILPISRALMFAMPPLYPISVIMAFELATYGLITGLAFRLLKPKFKYSMIIVLTTLVISMLAGRIVWGVVSYMLLSLNGTFTFSMFLSGAFITAWPGIVIQLLLIPLLIKSLSHTKYIDI